MLQTPASGYPGVMDDLIYSGAGSGCRGDDEDECTPPFIEGSGDDLITPVYVPPTKQPQQKGDISKTSLSSSSSGSSGAAGGETNIVTEKSCDDEDCLHGSGDNSIETTEQFTSTTSKCLFGIPFNYAWSFRSSSFLTNFHVTGNFLRFFFCAN